MSRLLAFHPHARVIVMLLAIVGPLFLMGMRGERIDIQVAMALAAGIAVGCSLTVAPLAFRLVAIVAAVAAIGFQVADVLGPDSAWGPNTAPILWVWQGALTGALAYLIWWNQHVLRRA